MSKLIDEKGRLFGKISLIDLIVILAVPALILGFVYNRRQQSVQDIIRADAPLFITFVAEGVRPFTVDAVTVGDVIFRRDEASHPIGTIVHVDVDTHYVAQPTTDGTVLRAPVEGFYNLYITIEGQGSITNLGYFLGGTQQMSPGMRVPLQTNRLSSTFTVRHVAESLN